MLFPHLWSPFAIAAKLLLYVADYIEWFFVASTYQFSLEVFICNE